MTRLSDIQLVLLSSAAQRADGSVMPPPEAVGGQAVRISRTIPILIRHTLVSEAEVADAKCGWRRDGTRHIGAFITDAGRAAIGAEPILPEDPGVARPDTVVPIVGQPAEVASTPKSGTKTGQVLAMLTRTDGATLDELVAATGWLPHTTRAALSGLRKKGHAITRGKRGAVTCYTLAAA
ncbi:DUF3489 domain-containing protein [Sphingomonas nostoxanthinifaciens]|uniref:DUF3489 domain-containing protein n=1 Tax=Sphingomonas nostoxanthinifaciens TaxID=2872652 RepID=UPI001CC1C757|nr:DUF3489 domain-containing protein [Sphingomonas nostoxanthinifaciens]UAK25270.1 DUF3489 domain-containing protein [Sphingomonas nostoxanthinifaciens]